MKVRSWPHRSRAARSTGPSHLALRGVNVPACDDAEQRIGVSLIAGSEAFAIVLERSWANRVISHRRCRSP